MSITEKNMEIWVLNCPLMIEGDSHISKVTLSFCRECEYHIDFSKILEKVRCRCEK